MNDGLAGPLVQSWAPEKDCVLTGFYYNGAGNVAVSSRPDPLSTFDEFNSAGVYDDSLILLVDDYGSVFNPGVIPLNVPLLGGRNIYVASSRAVEAHLFVSDPV